MLHYFFTIHHLKKWGFKGLIIISLLFITRGLFSQAQMVLNDDVYLTMNGGTAGSSIYLVIDNPNDNALSTAGSGGNLLSENEFNIVRWNIGSNLGSYTLPYTTGTGTNVKMPLTYTITSAGLGGTPIDFSTYPTAVNNTPYATMVNHVLDQNTETMDNSDYILDRFWLIDAMSYSTRPGAEMIISYDPAETNSNIVTPGNMYAQRYDSSADSWTGGAPGIILTFGTDNAPAQQVENIVVPPNEMFEAWTIFDNTNPLPVELTYFTATCKEDFVQLEWETASETNASHFIVEKSTDGIHWENIQVISAQGNTTNTTSYSFSDFELRNEIVYYRLVQIDYDGKETIYGAESASPCSVNELTWTVSTHENDIYGLTILSPIDQDVTLLATAMSGQKVAENRTLHLVKGKNLYYFDAQKLVVGMYLLNLLTDNQTLTHKIIKQQ